MSLDDIYNETKQLDGTNLLYFLCDAEPLSFEEDNKDNKWIKAMNKEIQHVTVQAN